MVGDARDQDCDGVDGVDADGDGFASESSGGEDCNDADERTYQGAIDVAGDAADQNCDGADGEDADGDGFASIESGGTDCDDFDGTVQPGAVDNEGWRAEEIAEDPLASDLALADSGTVSIAYWQHEPMGAPGLCLDNACREGLCEHCSEGAEIPNAFNLWVAEGRTGSWVSTAADRSLACSGEFVAALALAQAGGRAPVLLYERYSHEECRPPSVWSGDAPALDRQLDRHSFRTEGMVVDETGTAWVATKVGLERNRQGSDEWEMATPRPDSDSPAGWLPTWLAVSGQDAFVGTETDEAVSVWRADPEGQWSEEVICASCRSDSASAGAIDPITREPIVAVLVPDVGVELWRRDAGGWTAQRFPDPAVPRYGTVDVVATLADGAVVLFGRSTGLRAARFSGAAIQTTDLVLPGEGAISLHAEPDDHGGIHVVAETGDRILAYGVLRDQIDGVDQNCDGVDGVDADGDGRASIETGGDDPDDQDPSV